MRYTAVLLSLLLLVSACGGYVRPAGTAASTPLPVVVAAPGDAPTAVDIASDYQLDTGDRLRVRVFGEEQMTGEYDVDSGGNVTFPLIGIVAVRGQTATAFSDALKEKLKQGFLIDPQLTVDVLNYRPFYIIGEVKQPGSYAYVNGMNVVNAVALAGGFTYRAKEDVALIKRAKNPSAEELGGPQTIVLPGDVIAIPERYF